MYVGWLVSSGIYLKPENSSQSCDLLMDNWQPAETGRLSDVIFDVGPVEGRKRDRFTDNR